MSELEKVVQSVRLAKRILMLGRELLPLDELHPEYKLVMDRLEAAVAEMHSLLATRH